MVLGSTLRKRQAAKLLQQHLNQPAFRNELSAILKETVEIRILSDLETAIVIRTQYGPTMFKVKLSEVILPR